MLRQLMECIPLDLQQIAGVRCLFPGHFHPEADMRKEQDGPAIQVLQADFRIKGQGVRCADREIKFFAAAFLDEELVAVWPGMHDGQLIGLAAQAFREGDIVLHVGR